MFPHRRLSLLHRLYSSTTSSTTDFLPVFTSTHFFSSEISPNSQENKETDDPFKSYPSFHRLSTINSKSQLLQSYTVTPPINPWPKDLSHKRLISLISRQHDLKLALQIFHHAGKFHPNFSHNYQTYQFIIQKLSRARAFQDMETLLDELKRVGISCAENLFIVVIRNYGIASKPKKSPSAISEDE